MHHEIKRLLVNEVKLLTENRTPSDFRQSKLVILF